MDSFPIAPAATRLSLVSRSAHFDVTSAGVSLKGDWYGREIPAVQVRAAEARRVDLSTESELTPDALLTSIRSALAVR